MDDTLDDFGYGGEIGDWSVVRKIFFVQRGFLEKGSVSAEGELTSSKTQVDYASDDGGNDTGAVLEK